jgi:hypothetical protein
MKKIEIIVDKRGKVNIETFNFSGNECIKATEELLNLLGGHQNETKKDKFYVEIEGETIEKEKIYW